MEIKSLIDAWGQPKEKIQLTLRIFKSDRDRLEAINQQFPNMTLNDMVSGILREGLDVLERELEIKK